MRNEQLDHVFIRRTVALSDLSKMRRLCRNKAFYATIWRYPDKDYKRCAEAGESIADLYFDVDNDYLWLAKASGSDLIDHLAHIDVPEKFIRVYFSGSKGFHIEVPHQLFGVKPNKKVALAYKSIAKELKEEVCPDIDLAVYENKRLWRVVNSVNEKSNLYKIPLSVREIRKFSVENILTLAKRQRTDIYRNNGTDIKPIPKLATLYQDHEHETPALELENNMLDEDGYCGVAAPILVDGVPCIDHILADGLPIGIRNEGIIRLATYYKNIGYTKGEALKKLLTWNKTRNDFPLFDYEIKETVKSAFKRPLNYGCKDYILQRYCEKRRCFVSKKYRSTLGKKQHPKFTSR